MVQTTFWFLKLLSFFFLRRCALLALPTIHLMFHVGQWFHEKDAVFKIIEEKVAKYEKNTTSCRKNCELGLGLRRKARSRHRGGTLIITFWTGGEAPTRR